MRINFVTFSCNLTGGNRVVAELVNGLSDLGHEVTWVTLGTPEDLSWIRLRARVVHVRRTLSEKVAGFLYRIVFGFQPFPEEETRKILAVLPDADANVATISYSGFAVHRSPSGVPLQYFMHFEPYVREEGYKKRVIAENYYLPNRIIVNSTWLADTIGKETGRMSDSVKCVFPAIDHDIFTAQQPKTPPRKDGQIKIVSLAKHKWWKGFPDALRAVKLLRERGYNIEFQAFGGFLSSDMLPEDVRDVAFTYAGRKADAELARFYREADILLSASYFESFPLPPIEAMACGVPVVTTRYGTEDYALHRENAYVTEPKNPEALADGLAYLIENPDFYTQCSRRGMETAREFTWQRAAREMEQVITDAIATSISEQ